MTEVTADGRAVMSDAAARYGVSYDAVVAVARAVQAGGGAAAEFNVPELGGAGRWSGETADLANAPEMNDVVSNLCMELSNAMRLFKFFSGAAEAPAATAFNQQPSAAQALPAQSYGGGWSPTSGVDRSRFKKEAAEAPAVPKQSYAAALGS